jgi:hypothetical protein
MPYIVQIVALLFAAVIGSQLPDIDQWLFFLRNQHRSIITHSPLIPGALFWAAQGRGPVWKWAGAGLAAAVAAALARDLFPRGWSGYALISVPFFGRLDGTLSMIWLTLSIVACWYLALLLIENRRDVLFVLVAGGLAFVLDVNRDRGAVVLPFIALVVLFVVASFLPNPALNGRNLTRDTYTAFTSWRQRQS